MRNAFLLGLVILSAGLVLKGSDHDRPAYAASKWSFNPDPLENQAQAQDLMTMRSSCLPRLRIPAPTSPGLHLRRPPVNRPGGLHNARCTTLPRPLVRFHDAAILTATRLFRLARPVAATNLEGFGWPRAISRQLSAISFGDQRSAPLTRLRRYELSH